MSGISDLMSECPLKQYIRDKFWVPNINKLKKNQIRYLTLYEPPAIDIRHFHKRGLIEYKDAIYRGVVGVTYNEEGYSKTINNLQGRPELLKLGEMNKLLQSEDKELISKFPFDVINLDFCNHIVNNYISDNLESIALITKHQKASKCEKYILFVTSRTDRDPTGFKTSFIEFLKARINVNIKGNSEFRKKYNSLFGTKPPDRDNFLLIGIVKELANILSVQGYVIDDCEAVWLIRDNRSRQLDLLHLAFLVSLKKPNTSPKRFSEHGGGLEFSAVRILDELIDNHVETITEKKDSAQYEKMYGTYLDEIRDTNYELSIPAPTN